VEVGDEVGIEEGFIAHKARDGAEILTARTSFGMTCLVGKVEVGDEVKIGEGFLTSFGMTWLLTEDIGAA
jgi:hypothetical protein